MVGTEDEDAHAYLKPKNFNGKFFSELTPKDAQIMFLDTVIPMTCKDILNFINEKDKFGAKSADFTIKK